MATARAWSMCVSSDKENTELMDFGQRGSSKRHARTLFYQKP